MAYIWRAGGTRAGEEGRTLARTFAAAYQVALLVVGVCQNPSLASSSKAARGVEEGGDVQVVVPGGALVVGEESRHHLVSHVMGHAVPSSFPRGRNNQEAQKAAGSVAGLIYVAVVPTGGRRGTATRSGRQQHCERGGARACGRAGVRACGRAGVRACGRGDDWDSRLHPSHAAVVLGPRPTLGRHLWKRRRGQMRAWEGKGASPAG
jgi:hypothetical protein